MRIRQRVSMILWGAAFASVVLTGIITGCKSDNPVGEGGSPSNVVFPTSNVSYQTHVQTLFNQTCSLVGCHDDGQPPDRVRLTTYENLMFGAGGTPMVIPGNPDASQLVFRIEGRVGQRMPLNRNALNQNQIEGIKTWIREGARNN